MPELRHYRYFAEIARRGTFTAAAESLHMTQSALSEQILQFERESGCRLFHRHHSGIKLTPAGEYLLPHAERLLQRAVEAEVGLASFRQGYQERIRIGSVLGPLQSWLPRALAQFAQLEPRIQLQVDYDNVDPILARVASGQLDIGVVVRGRPHARSRGEGLQEALLVEEDMVVLVPAGHPLAQLAGVTPEDLREVHLLTFPPGYALRRITDHWFRRAGCTPMVAAESGVVEVLLQLAQDGVGVAIVPRSLSWRAQASGLRIVDVAPGDVPRRSLVAVTRREDEGSNLLRTLTSLMEVHARDAARRPAVSDAGDLDGEVGAPEGPRELR